jgi:secretion/DNA translocation related TadE-like protein
MTEGAGQRSAAGAEGGSATVWVIAGIALVMLVASAGALRAEAVLARHQVARSADLAALAAAAQIGQSVAPCQAARPVAELNAVRLVSCVAVLDASGRSGTVAVAVERTVPVGPAGRRLVKASARAGRLGSPAPLVETPP